MNDSIVDKIIKIARENNISCDVSQDSENTVVVSITWGDWKHDHARLVWLIFESGIKPKRHNAIVTEENGTDCYSAQYIFEF